MASRYFINGGVDNSYGTTGNWSDVSGGTGGFSVPTSVDDVFFDLNSPSCNNLVSNRTCLSLTTTGYNNTLTLTHTLNVQTGNCTIGSSTIFAGTGTLSLIGTGGSHTANGITIPNLSITGNSTTNTLTDTFTVAGLTTLGSSTQSITVNGGAIVCLGGLTCGASSGSVTGTTTITLAGTGTWTGPSTTGTLRLPVTINTAGTITLGTRVGFGGTTFTYITGTVVTTGSTFDVITAGATLDCDEITFNNLHFESSVTHTLNSNLYADGLLSLGNTTANVVLNGNTIFARGGVRFAGTTGSITGSTVIHVDGAQTLDAPSRTTTGRFDLPIVLDAPSATITIDDGFVGTLSNLDIVDGTTISTETGSFTILDTGLTATGGAVVGSSGTSFVITSDTATGGTVAGGESTLTTFCSEPTSGGSLAGNSADVGQILFENGSGGAVAGGVASHSLIIQSILVSGGGVVGGAARHGRILPQIASGGVLSGGTAPFQVFHIPAVSGGIEAAGQAYIRVDYYITADGGLEVTNISQLHYQYPKPLVPEIPGKLTIGGSAICTLGHMNHDCRSEGEGLVCLTNIPNRHRHCFHSDYYISGSKRTKYTKSTGGYVPAITVCRQGVFMPFENRRAAPKS